jgi:hypothetical protein
VAKKPSVTVPGFVRDSSKSDSSKERQEEEQRKASPDLLERACCRTHKDEPWEDVRLTRGALQRPFRDHHTQWRTLMGSLTPTPAQVHVFVRAVDIARLTHSRAMAAACHKLQELA